MGDEAESGGVLAVRAWAVEAVGRARALLPEVGLVATATRAHDASVAELDELSRLLDQAPELRSSVTLWLAGVLTLRHAAGGGAPEDRKRAHGLLREVRDPATETGATASAEDRRWAALFLLTHAMPLQESLGGIAPEPDATAVFDMIMQEGPAGMTAFAAEMQELMADAVELPLPPETLAHLHRVRDLFAAPSAATAKDMFLGLFPDDGLPGTERMRSMMGDWLSTVMGGPQPESRPGPDTAGKRPAPDAAGRPGAGAPGPSATAGTGSAAPGDTPAPPLNADDFRRLLAAVQAVNTTSVDFVDHAGGGDPAALNQQLRRLREALDGLPEGMPGRDALRGNMAMLLDLSEGAGGTLQDRALGSAHSRVVTDYLRSLSGSSFPMAGSVEVMADVMGLATEVRTAFQAEDPQRLGALLRRAEELAAAVPDDHDFLSFVRAVRAMARLAVGRFTGDKELILSGIEDLDEARTAAANSGFPIGADELEAMVPGLTALRALITEDTERMPEREIPPPDASAAELHTAANSLGIRYDLTKDPEDLDAVITVLERLREHIRQGRAPRVAAQSLWTLAESYRIRRHRESSESSESGESDAGAVCDAAGEALAALAADVLLQQGAEHRLATARQGASLGIRSALWAAFHNRVDDAVAALELGRALVLQTAATSRAVPELLEERGHPRLAAAWRESGTTDTGELPPELPSTLRRQALEALGYRERGGLLNTPTPGEIAAGLAEAGADALIYLVPGSDGDAPGMLLAIGPEIGIGLAALPMLARTASGPLERYLDAARERPTGGPAAEQAWEDALSELCDWAYEAFVQVLAGLDTYLPGDAADRRTPRVVLVPCGRLGIVPWHAARAPHSPHSYVCQSLVISYAASGSQFLSTVKRAPRNPVSAPAMVADPGMTLTYAELEVLELRNACYPGARLYGEFYRLPKDSVPAGTPGELLSLLAQDHSVVHLATHGMAGIQPTESALHLAPDPSGADPGLLTVTGLLDRPRPPGPAASDGPLIVLSGCQTDLSNRDHDEALTLTTAFVSGGARDVVGSRWTTYDSAASLLMAVFHRQVRAGLAPVDALRAAQLWMLDPDRKDPGLLDPELRRDVSRPDLERPVHWAAFIHQGHPGAGGTTV
ncbi:CHAT domain-containing protein [Streptomyces tsukubensis]|uniref:CHAT domain-containing protein n=1 Tax=Streptomyces tsukubensis TaxID=83656 RepID=UPI00344B681E